MREPREPILEPPVVERPRVVIYDRSDRDHAHEAKRDLAALAVGLAALLLALGVIAFVLWVSLSSVKATPFDADGVRCYSRAGAMSCIKTAEPPR